MPNGDGDLTGIEDKRRTILRAAVKVFAERGYHGCRVADVAREAGVAYGLVYHYFENKEALLASIFEESWRRFADVVGAVAAADLPISEKIDRIFGMALEAYRRRPHSVQVMILEIARSPLFVEKHRLEAFQQTIEVTSAMLREGQRQGEVRADLDPRHGAYLIYGALELLLTGFVLHTLDDTEPEAFHAARRDAVRVLTAGLAG